MAAPEPPKPATLRRLTRDDETTLSLAETASCPGSGDSVAPSQGHGRSARFFWYSKNAFGNS